MNYFYSQNHQQLLSKLVNNAVFPTLIEYLHHHQEEDIILRELKKNFDHPKFEAFLDQLIDENLIKRENRRYKLNFPIFEEETYQKEIEEAEPRFYKLLVLCRKRKNSWLWEMNVGKNVSCLIQPIFMQP
ncbi:DUF1803 domain-containing protein [Enterococcus hirae]